MLTRVSYYHNIVKLPANVAIGGLALDLPDILIFVLFYILAILNRADLAAYMRYMTGTSLLMIGPGLGRALIIFGAIPFPVAVTYTMYLAELITAIFIVFDYFKGNSTKPYPVILTGLGLLHLCWSFQME